MLSKRWEIAPENPRVEAVLAAALQTRPLAARLLVNRGITSIEAARIPHSFLAAPPRSISCAAWQRLSTV